MTDYLKERKGTMLIAPSYTQKEYIALNDKNVKAVNKPKQPPYFIVSVLSIDNKLHRVQQVPYESFQGRLAIEKACDQYAELTVEISVSSRHLFSNGMAKINDETVNMQLLETIAPGNYDQIDKSAGITTADKANLMAGDINKLGARTENTNDIGICTSATEYDTQEFIELRRNLLGYLDGRYMTLISNLFNPIEIAYIDDASYTIGEGEENSLYNITFHEYASFNR